MNLNAIDKTLAKFKTIDKMTKAELVSVLKEVQHRMLFFATTLNHATVPNRFYSRERLIEVGNSSYETWYYLNAIGAINTKYHEPGEDGFQCLKSPLATQRKFLSHTPKKKGNKK